MLVIERFEEKKGPPYILYLITPSQGAMIIARVLYNVEGPLEVVHGLSWKNNIIIVWIWK